MQNQYLSTNLLDYIIQRGAPSPTLPPLVASQDEYTAIPPLYVGGATIFFIKKANSLLDPKIPSSRKSLEIIWKNLKSYKETTLARGSKLVVPMVHNSHFFVIVIELTGKPWSDF